jgi:hypothetical protein
VVNPQNVYQMNQGIPYLKLNQNAPQRLVNQVKSNEQLKLHQQQQQQLQQQVARNSPGKPVNLNYLQERRVSGLHLRQEDKKSFYSPQVSKDAYLQSPQKPAHQLQQELSNMQNPANVRRMYSEQ